MMNDKCGIIKAGPTSGEIILAGREKVKNIFKRGLKSVGGWCMVM